MKPEDSKTNSDSTLFDLLMVIVLKELDQKWNAIVTIFEKKHNGQNPAAKDGFKLLCDKQFPSLKDLW